MCSYVEDSPYYSALTKEYNGTAWSSGGNLNTNPEVLVGGGNSTGAICMGGTSGSWLDTTEIYDGSSWSASDNMSAIRNYLSGGGSLSGLSAWEGMPRKDIPQ